MIRAYIKGKRRRAEDREIKTTVYNILKNTEAIGCKTMAYSLLVQRVCEHLEQINLTYTPSRVDEVITEMILENMIYRVTSEHGYNVGLT